MAEQALHDWAEVLRSLPEKLEKDSGEQIEKALVDFTKDHAGKGLDPNGKAWERTQDGEAPLRNAMQHIKSSHDGKLAKLTLTGRYARHSRGEVTGGIKRQVLPTVITSDMAADIKRRLREGRD